MNAPLSNPRFIIAMVVAVISDSVSIVTEFTPPVQWVVDGVTAAVLFFILGWRWQLLPALVAEAIPGVAAFPAWVLVVAAIRMTNTIPSKNPSSAGSSVPPAAPDAPRKRVDNTAKD
jgi:hypothetical protein